MIIVLDGRNKIKTLRALSPEIGVSVASLSRYENGKTINLLTLAKIARYENWSEGRLMRFIEDRLEETEKGIEK
jgi:transcriptional regulator with XRE-family HTH domain